jgi:hypothetical protein
MLVELYFWQCAGCQTPNTKHDKTKEENPQGTLMTGVGQKAFSFL